MTKVYVVSTGEDSDYEIDSIFSDEERAKKCAGMIDSGHASSNVDEFTLDPEKEILRRGYGYWRVHMFSDGEGTFTVVSQRKPDGFDSEYAEVFKATWTMSGKGYLKCRMKARDRDHAVKIANERRTAILAAHLWPDDPPTEE